VKEAASTWIAFLDDDDVWLPTKIERQWALVQQNPALGLVYCSDHAVDERLNFLYRRDVAPQNRGDVFDRLIVKNFIFTSCVIARKDLIERSGYMNPAYRFAEDWDLWLKIAATHWVDFVAEPLVLYRQSNSGCLTQDTPIAERLRDMERILASATTLRSLPWNIKRQARHALELQWAAVFLNKGDHTRAMWHSLMAAVSDLQSPNGYRALFRSILPKRVNA